MIHFSWNRLSPLQLLRLAGVLTAAVDALLTTIRRLQSPGSSHSLVDQLLGPGLPLPTAIAIDTFASAVIGLGFWSLCRERFMLTLPKWALGLLLLQTFTSWLSNPCNVYLASVQAGFILSSRGGAYWVLFQSLVQLGISFFLPSLARVLLPSHLATLTGWQLHFAHFSTGLIYHIFTFGLGALAASAFRQKIELRRKNAELAATRQIEADSARLAERLSISRDLHDELGHHLTGLSINLQLASKQTTGEAKATVDSAYLLARTVLSDIRNTVTDLRDAPAIQLPKALATLTAGIDSPHVHLKVSEGLDHVDLLPSHALFRSSQEMITNALRHAAASNLWIELTATATSYSLSIRDDGRGAKPFVLGNGLRGILERVSNLGGKVQFQPTIGQGFAAIITLPRRLDGTA